MARMAWAAIGALAAVCAVGACGGSDGSANVGTDSKQMCTNPTLPWRAELPAWRYT
jgi:hypothetical protein